MKKFTSLICAAAILLSAAACSSPPQAQSSRDSTPPGTAESQPAGTPAATPEAAPAAVSAAAAVWEEKGAYVTFGHVALGIQAQFPDLALVDILSTNGIVVYPHGFTLGDFDSTNAYEFSVEMSLAGETDLAQLPIAISNEKADIPDVRSDETRFGLTKVTAFHRTANVQVGEYQTFYFEIDAPGVDEYADRAVMGHSFLFEGKPVCVTVHYGKHKQYTKEDLQAYLQYMILTLAPYQGEAFDELQPDNHFSDFYSRIQKPQVEDLLTENPRGFTLYGFEPSTVTLSEQSDRGTQGDDLLYPRAYTNWLNDESVVEGEALLQEGLTYDGIFALVLEDEALKKEVGLWSNNAVAIEKEADVTISGIPMKRYEARVSGSHYDLTDFWVVYTFIYEDVPYLWKMDSGTVSMFEQTAEEAAYVMELIRLQADTMIRTIQLDT